MKFSLSCAWNGRIHTNALGMVQEIKNLGIDSIELSFALTKDFVCDIISMRDKRQVEVTSVHNFCPIPEGSLLNKASPDYYSLASRDEGERQKAIEATKATILTAERLEANVVILHLGRVDISDKTKALAGVLSNKSEYEAMREKMKSERDSRVARHFDKAIASLDELHSFAKNEGVMLGIETRYYYCEIPSLDELEIIMKRFNDKHIGYWHDTGHAQLFENLGLSKHRDFLDRFQHKLIGMHLHDIKGVTDHLAPLKGELDFTILRPYLKKSLLLVLEPHQPATAEEIKNGIAYLEKIFN